MLIPQKKMISCKALVCGLLIIISIASATVPLKFTTEKFGDSKLTKSTGPDIDYQTEYFEVPVDHFSYANTDTFKLRYLINTEHWKPGNPVFFYCGNEGDITWFCNNTGAMWDWAPEFSAMLVFAEHRYYGDSLPYGKDSYKDISKLGYLSSEQALADFADLLLHLKASMPGAGDSPIVAFGGSYGGMLAAWFRMKYPHVVVGSLAASAPLLYFGDIVPCHTFMQKVTQDFQKSGPNCASNIKRSWEVINKMAATDTGRSELTKSLHLCKPLTDASGGEAIKGWLNGMYGNLAMVDYPYPASFLEPLPAWPIKEVCKFLSRADLGDSELISALGSAANLYFNYTGATPCFNTSSQATDDLGDQGWNFQACTEMVMPMCSDGVHDMFEPSPWDIKAFSEGCKKQFGVVTRPSWAEVEYGGRNISAASNIIFSNGNLDPWSGGGVLNSLSDSLTAIIIEDGAHHLDLRSSNPEDPPSVISARKREKEIIKGWIEEHSGNYADRVTVQKINILLQSDSLTSQSTLQKFLLVTMPIVMFAMFLVIGGVLVMYARRKTMTKVLVDDASEHSPLM